MSVKRITPFILAAAGAAFIAAGITAIPREERARQWSFVGGALAITGLAAIVVERKGLPPWPRPDRAAKPSDGVVIPLRRRGA